PVDLDAVLEVARRHPLAVVEDAAEALGARYRGRPVGCDGLVSCLSFNGNKIITTGGGGMVLSRDEATAARVRRLTTQARAHAIEYVHEETGYNYRLTNLQAAGLSFLLLRRFNHQNSSFHQRPSGFVSSS